MRSELAPVPPVANLPRKRRRATTADKIRAAEVLRRIDAGETDTAAFWSVASDPAIGFSRFRGATARPPEIVLRTKLVALLQRAVPELVGAARDVAVGRLAGLADDAVRAVAEVTTGDCGDARLARARLDGARTVLAAIGISDRGSMTIATQVNVQQRSAFEVVPDGA